MFNQTLALPQDRHQARQADIAEHGTTALKGLTSRNSLIPALNVWKAGVQADPDTRDFSWLDDCSKFVREEAVVDAARALGNCFDSMAGAPEGPAGWRQRRGVSANDGGVCGLAEQ